MNYSDLNALNNIVILLNIYPTSLCVCTAAVYLRDILKGYVNSWSFDLFYLFCYNI